LLEQLHNSDRAWGGTTDTFYHVSGLRSQPGSGSETGSTWCCTDHWFSSFRSVDTRKYSRPSLLVLRRKFIAAAAISAEDKQLYSLVLTNFGCGPNSFILKIVEDIMAGKPLGQLEIDEHAAEAGIVTETGSFCRYYQRTCPFRFPRKSSRVQIHRGVSSFVHNGKTILIPRMAPMLTRSLPHCKLLMSAQ